MAKRKGSPQIKRGKKRKLNRIKILRSLLLFVLFIGVLGYVSFRLWKKNQLEKALEHSQIVYTDMGPIAYKSIGSGPVILLSHMGASGSDNIKQFQEIADQGYRIICPSRPGYLSTPLSENADIEFIADLYAKLLEKLNIKEKVFVMGISLGGPYALEFSAQYPEKCKGVILHSAISKHFSPLNRMKKYSQLINIMLSPTWQDSFSWISYRGSQIYPRYFIQQMLERGTTLDHKKTKELAKELSKYNSNNEALHLFNAYTSPLSYRTNGLENDIKNAESYKAKKFKLPLLVTHSKIDKVVDVFHAEHLKKRLPQAELFIYEGYGHAFWFGKAWKDVKSKTLEFLKTHRKTKETTAANKNFSFLTKETWVNNSNGALLKINEDGSFNLDFPGVDEKEYVKGSVKIDDDIIVFMSDKSSDYCKNISGKYRFSIKADKLSLIPVKDTCKRRKELFASGWFKL